MSVEEGVGKKEHPFLGVDDVHGADVVQSLADANHLFRNIGGLLVLAEDTGDHGVGLTSFDHHHAEVVAFEHLFGCLLEGHPLTISFFCEQRCIVHATWLFTVVPQVDDLDSFQADVVLPCHVGNLLFVAH